jgi:prepilin peptidase CpaA
MNNHLILQIAVMVVVIVASVVDIRTTKIPNWLTFGSAPIGIILNALFGWQAALWAIAGWVAGVVVMLFFKVVITKQMGMGDTKLIAAIGAFLGLKGVLIVWGYFALLFGAYATFKFLTAIPWSHFGKMVQAATMGLPSTLDAEAAQKLTTVMKTPIPLAPIIAAGTLAAILLEKPTLTFLGLPTT